MSKSYRLNKLDEVEVLMKVRLLLFAFLSVVFSALLIVTEARPLEMFFLDWKQILLSGRPADNLYKIIDVSGFKTKGNTAGKQISAKDLLILLDEISKEKPRAVVLAISEDELGHDLERNTFFSELEKRKDVYVFSNSTTFKDSRLSIPEDKFSRGLYLLITNDSQIDSASRRILKFYDLEGKKPSYDFEEAKRVVGYSEKPENFPADIEYLETKQFYMRIWPWFDFEREYISSPFLGKELGARLQDKVVILDTEGIFSLISSPSILRRLPWSSKTNMKTNYWSGGSLLATHLSNLTSNVYIKQPGRLADALWLSFGVVALVYSLLFVSIRRAWWVSTGVLLAYLLLGALAFKLFSYNFDSGKVLILGLILQYVILPYRYLRRIRKLDQESFQKQKQLVEERLNTRILVKAAITESTLRTVGQVSHDIRSPLTALNIASALVKPHVSAELRDLIVNATQRIENISEDLTRSYKGKAISSQDPNTNFLSAMTDLISSYKHVDSDLIFNLEIPNDLNIFWPILSVQRSFSNLINNSMDACRSMERACEISIQAKIMEGRIQILYRDNGPGVPTKVRGSLFTEGATFGKESGTGLGLFQVRGDLLSVGGTIFYEDQGGDAGACFVISLPREVKRVELAISSLVVLIENGLDSSLVQALQKSGALVHKFLNFPDAKVFLETNLNKEMTLISELILSQGDETVFDLLDSCGAIKFFKVVVYSSVNDNEGIKSIANKRGALLVRKDFLSQVELKIST